VDLDERKIDLELAQPAKGGARRGASKRGRGRRSKRR
jgi:hypothetical protein